MIAGKGEKLGNDCRLGREGDRVGCPSLRLHRDFHTLHIFCSSLCFKLKLLLQQLFSDIFLEKSLGTSVLRRAFSSSSRKRKKTGPPRVPPPPPLRGPHPLPTLPRARCSSNTCPQHSALPHCPSLCFHLPKCTFALSSLLA